MSPQADSHIVIVGAGIIGCATAYYLTRTSNVKSSQIHLVESSTELFSSASGKSGGFLAEDWFGPATASLGSLSFRLHEELAREHDGHQQWGYSRSTGTSVLDAALPANTKRGEDWLRQGSSRAESAGIHEFHNNVEGPAWLAKHEGSSIEMIGEQNSVAQVDPLRLSRFLLDSAISSGVVLHQPATPLSLTMDSATNNITHLTIQSSTSIATTQIPCTHLLLTSGAWTPQVFTTLFPTSPLHLPITSLAGHSLVIRSPRWKSATQSLISNKIENGTIGTCHAIFTTTTSGISPEIFSRMGDEIYIAGVNSADEPLPERPELAILDGESVQMLRELAVKYLGDGTVNDADAVGEGVLGGGLEIVREGLCFRPVTPKGVPIMDRIADERLGNGMKTIGGVFVAAGHGPWGISQSLGTGLVMAEMLEGKKKFSADVSGLRLQQ